MEYHAEGMINQWQFRNNIIANWTSPGSVGYRYFSTFTEGRTPPGIHSNASVSYGEGTGWTSHYCMWLDAFYDDGAGKLKVKATGFHNQNLHNASPGAGFPNANLTGRFRVYTDASLTNEDTTISSAATPISPFGGADNADAIQVDHFLLTHTLTGFSPNTNYWIVFERSITTGGGMLSTYTHTSKPVVIKTPSAPGSAPGVIEITPVGCTHRDRFPNSGVQLLGLERADDTTPPSVHRLSPWIGDIGYHDDNNNERPAGTEMDGAQSLEEFYETWAKMLTCHTSLRFFSTACMTGLHDDHETFDNIAMIPLESDTSAVEWWQNGGLIYRDLIPPPQAGTKRGYSISPRDLLLNSLNSQNKWLMRGIPSAAELANSTSRRFLPAGLWGDGVTSYSAIDGWSRSYDYGDTRIVLMDFRRYRNRVLGTTPTYTVIKGGNQGTAHQQFFFNAGAGVFDDANCPSNLVVVMPQPISDVQLDGAMHTNEAYSDWNEVREERNAWMKAIETNPAITSVFTIGSDSHFLALSDHQFHRSESGSFSVGSKWVGELLNGGWLAGGQNPDGMAWDVSKPYLLTARGWYNHPQATVNPIGGTCRGTSVVTLNESAQTYLCQFADASSPTTLTPFFEKVLRPSATDPIDLLKGLVSLYKFKTDGTDSIVAVGNTLTVNGTPSFVPGLVDGAVELNIGHFGDSLSISPGSYRGLGFGNNRAFSVFFWVQFQTYGPGEALLGSWISPNNESNRFLIQTNTNNPANFIPSLQYRDNNGWKGGANTDMEQGVFPTSGGTDSSKWTWIEFSYDPVEGKIYLGWNNTTTNWSRSLTVGLNEWRLGDPGGSAFAVGPGGGTRARICQLAVFNRFLPLHGAERARIYNYGKGLPFAKWSGRQKRKKKGVGQTLE